MQISPDAVSNAETMASRNADAYASGDRSPAVSALKPVIRNA
jgi:hypothetical protein